MFTNVDARVNERHRHALYNCSKQSARACAVHSSFSLHTDTQFIFKQSFCGLQTPFNIAIRTKHLRINDLLHQLDPLLLEMKLPALLVHFPGLLDSIIPHSERIRCVHSCTRYLLNTMCFIIQLVGVGMFEWLALDHLRLNTARSPWACHISRIMS